jgi:hypothetical protein
LEWKRKEERERKRKERERERKMAGFGRMSCWSTPIVDRQKFGRQQVSLHKYFGQVIIGRLFDRHYQVIIGHGMSCLNLPSELL